jgi:hypothetical protein
MATERPAHNRDQLALVLGICEDFLRHANPVTRAEIDALLLQHGITGGPGWLIDMRGFTRLRLQSHALDATINPPDEP